MSNSDKPDFVKRYEPWCTLLAADPLAVPLSRLLAVLRVHPNVITAISLLSGLATGVLFGSGYWIWGAAAFHFSFLMDCVDGKVARLRGMTSDFGAWLDEWGDWTRKPASFIGIAVFFYANELTLFAILTCVVSVAHKGMHESFRLFGVLHTDLEFPVFYRKVIRRVFPRSLALYTYFEEQFIGFVVFPLIAALVGLPSGGVWFLWGIVVTMGLTGLKLIILLRHRWRGAYGQVHQDWHGTGGALGDHADDAQETDPC
ncbi:MAG: CDP-alcohol phosphatidyltransferase family protein [Planctomycetia bacterium]|nr:CDP-alcohol phosphatidyltransferase family protein [Planctomycetia bacterium]